MFPAGSLYQIGVLQEYVAFTGDLTVNYSRPLNVSIPDAFIRVLADTAQGLREITALKLSVGHATGSGRITCGVIETTGRHVLEMRMYVGGPVLTTTEFIVHWPKFHLYLPNNHIAQTTVVQLRYTSEAKCVSLLQVYSFQIDLEYRQARQSDPSFYSTKPRIIHTEAVTDISQTNTNVNYTCETFDLQGSCRAVLRNSFRLNETIARSNFMDVKWSNGYNVIIHSSSVHPCNGKITVVYEHPKCSNSNDKIRMYKLRRAVTGSLAAPLERIYVTERYAHPYKTFVIFKCDLFPITAVGFCFVYISVSSSGSVMEQHSSCISAHNDTGNV